MAQVSVDYEVCGGRQLRNQPCVTGSGLYPESWYSPPRPPTSPRDLEEACGSFICPDAAPGIFQRCL